MGIDVVQVLAIYLEEDPLSLALFHLGQADPTCGTEVGDIPDHRGESSLGR